MNEPWHPSKGLKKNEIYYNNNNKHAWNLALFNVGWPLFILQKVGNVDVKDNQCKIN
jgi:hypothetical protein